MQYVHRECLATNERHRDPDTRGACPVCKAPYDEAADIQPVALSEEEQAAENRRLARRARRRAAAEAAIVAMAAQRRHRILAAINSSRSFAGASCLIAVFTLLGSWLAWSAPDGVNDFRCQKHLGTSPLGIWLPEGGGMVAWTSLCCILGAVAITHAAIVAARIDGRNVRPHSVAHSPGARFFFAVFTLVVVRSASTVPRLPFLILLISTVVCVCLIGRVAAAKYSSPAGDASRRVLVTILLLFLVGMHLDPQVTALVRGSWGNTERVQCGGKDMDIAIPVDAVQTSIVAVLYAGEAAYRLFLFPYVTYLASSGRPVVLSLHYSIVAFFVLRDIASIIYVSIVASSPSLFFFPTAFFVSIVVSLVHVTFMSRMVAEGRNRASVNRTRV